MSAKINKNGKEYPIGIIPQNVIDDVTELKSAVDVLNTYSSSAVQVGTFLNKPLYRKTIQVAVNIPSLVVTTVASGFLNKGIVEMYGIIKQTDGSIVSLGHYFDPTSYSTLYMDINGDIRVLSKSAGDMVCITILYYDN